MKLTSLVVTCIAALCMSLTVIDPSQAQRPGGGGGGGRPGGGGGGGRPGGGGPGGPGKGMGKGGVNSETMMADWKLPRPHTWNLAKKDKLPLVMVFMSKKDAATASYFNGKEVAEISRGESYWVKIPEGHVQDFKDRGDEEDPTGLSGTNGGGGAAAGDGPADDESEKKDAEKKDTEKKDEPAKDAKKDAKPTGDKPAEKAAFENPKPGEAPKPGEKPADKPAGDKPEGDKPAGEKKEPEKPVWTPSIRAPGNLLMEADLWKAYGVTKADTFLVCDYLGNVYKRFTSKPSIGGICESVRAIPADMKKEEEKLKVELDKVNEIKAKGDLAKTLKAIAAVLDRKRYGYTVTDELAKMLTGYIDDAREKMGEYEDQNQRAEVEKMYPTYKGTELEPEIAATITRMGGTVPTGKTDKAAVK